MVTWFGLSVDFVSSGCDPSTIADSDSVERPVLAFVAVSHQTDPRRVAIWSGATDYRASNEVGELVRQAIEALGLPADFIRTGDHVVLKPNWVKEHDERRPGPDAWEHVVTHPGVIEAVARWVAPQLNGSGSIVMCDAPQTDSSFAALRRYCGLDEMIERLRSDFPGLRIELLDLRPEEWKSIDGVTVSRTKLVGDPLGSTQVNLDAASEFVGFRGCGQLYGASYDMAETNRHHTGTTHEYLLCRTAMDADVFINVPKLKTHKKVGLTCALKNLVGINADKNWLPHHTEGVPSRGGDQFPHSTVKARLENTLMGTAKRFLKDRPALARFFVPLKQGGRLVFGDTQQVVRSGNWHGNDTCWRMVLDLNKCLLSFDGTGERRETPRRYLAVVDGIVGGEGMGPFAPDPVACGVVLAGTNPLTVDVAAATLMGFDWQRMGMLRGGFDMSELDFSPFGPGEIQVVSNRQQWQGGIDDMADTFAFVPHFGWRGAIERQVPAGHQH